MSEKKQELQVAALENGTVIDHIPSENLFTVVSLLGLEHMNNNITIESWVLKALLRLRINFSAMMKLIVLPW